ncbi:MAG: PKD domain-containing protein [Bacteroidetes bacterium]|nr:PKD domain-containing protein [Bacteroidota bacterium]
MRWRTFYLFVFFSATCNLFAQPNTIPGLRLWFEADSGIVIDLISGKVKMWNDISGNMNNLVQSDTSLQPEIIVNNSNLNTDSILKFNLKKLVSINNINISGDAAYSVFIVNKYDSIFSTNTGVLGWGQSAVPLGACGVLDYLNTDTAKYHVVYSGGNNAIFTQMDTNYNILSVLKTPGAINATNQMFKNGIQLPMQVGSSASNPNFTNTPLTVGQWTDYNNPAYRLIGDIAEIIIYDTALTSTQRQQVEQYLSNKYAPPVNLGNDTTIAYGFCPFILNAHKDWFTSYQWNTGQTTDSIMINSSGSYAVSVTNIFGFTSSDTIKVIYPGNFSPFPDTTICYGTSINWNTQLNKTGYTFLWQDGSTDSLIAITKAGTYSVQVSDTNGCTFYSSPIIISVDSFSYTTTLGKDTSICSGASIGLTVGASQAVNYLWSTGATSSSIVVTTSGTYSVTVQNNLGCTAKDTINVTIKGVKPVAAFSAPDVCSGDTTFFKDLSAATSPDSVSAWNWNFGDGNNSSLQNPPHTYTSSGTFSVTLTVFTDSGCVATFPDTIHVYANPIANFNFTTPACSGNPTYFIDGSSDSLGSITVWNWNFGDTKTGSGKNITHIYQSAGTYSVQLIVTSDKGCTDTVVKTVTVKSSPSASFTSTSVCAGSNTSFAGSSSDLNATYVWNFGDATPSGSGKNIQHPYASAGTYSVVLTVIGQNGCTTTDTGLAMVYNNPIPGFTILDSVCRNSPVHFSDASTVTNSTIASWNWLFNNGNPSSSSQQNPVVTYSATGTNVVSLTVTSAQGCSLTVANTVVVHPLPQPAFTFSPQYGSPPLVVNFTNTSTGGNSYLWNFGDNYQSGIVNPAHTYQDTGTYIIQLLASNQFGCEDSMRDTLYVVSPLLDVAVTAVSGLNQSNTLKIYATLLNAGTLFDTTIEISAWLDGGIPVHETWSGLLKQKNSIVYEFNSSFELGDNQKHSIVCVEVKNVNGKQDDVSSNNKKCAAITNEFTLLDPFPNPTSDEIYFLFVSPDASSVKAEIYDARGRLVENLFDGNAARGLNQIIYNTFKLDNGIYVLKLSGKEKVLMKKFMKR